VPLHAGHFCSVGFAVRFFMWCLWSVVSPAIAAAVAGCNLTGVPSFVNAPTPDGTSGTDSLGDSLIDLVQGRAPAVSDPDREIFMSEQY
jgi:hypothetical protein